MSRPYFESTQVLKVFPSAYRVFDGGSKFTSEKNITNLIKSLAGGKGSFTIKDDNNTTTFPIVVDGYYFELDWNAVISAAGPAGNLWVKINVQQDYLLSFSTTTTLDDSNGFTALQYTTNPDSDSWFQILQDGMPVNTGYIPELVDDRGNWIDITQIFDVTYDGSGNQIVTIKEGALKFDNKTYVENLISQYATALSDSEGNKLDKGSTILPVYFSDGVPVVMGPTGTNKNIGWNTSGDSGIKPIWFDGTDTTSKGFKPISGTQGTDTKPVYVIDGAIKPIKYSISTNISGGGNNKLAYYDSNGNIAPSNYSIAATIKENTGGKTNVIAVYDGKNLIKPISSGVGDSSHPIYIDSNGIPQALPYGVNATVNAGTAGKLAYFSDANTISAYTGSTTTNKPVYFSSGLPTPITTTAGTRSSSIGNKSNPGRYQNTYFSSGSITAGQQIFVSTEDANNTRPSGVTYSTGDLWFRISNS